MEPLKFAGAVLAGGNSRRMGTDKAFLMVDGAPMITVAIEALLRGGAVGVRVFGGDTNRLLVSGFDAVPDEWPNQGPLGALVQAIEWAQGVGVTHVMVLACDLPRACLTTVRALASEATNITGEVLVPLLNCHPQWLHACWPVEVGDTLRSSFEEGERAVHRAVKDFPFTNLDGLKAESLLDVDWPSELGEVCAVKPGRGR